MSVNLNLFWPICFAILLILATYIFDRYERLKTEKRHSKVKTIISLGVGGGIFLYLVILEFKILSETNAKDPYRKKKLQEEAKGVRIACFCYLGFIFLARFLDLIYRRENSETDVDPNKLAPHEKFETEINFNNKIDVDPNKLSTEYDEDLTFSVVYKKGNAKTVLIDVKKNNFPENHYKAELLRNKLRIYFNPKEAKEQNTDLYFREYFYYPDRIFQIPGQEDPILVIRDNNTLHIETGENNSVSIFRRNLDHKYRFGEKLLLTLNLEDFPQNPIGVELKNDGINIFYTGEDGLPYFKEMQYEG